MGLIHLGIVGMQMKASLGGYLTSVRTAFIRNTNGEECWCGCVCARVPVSVSGEGGALTLLLGVVGV